MALPWPHYGCLEGGLRNVRAEASGRSWGIDLAETLQLSTVAIALHALKRIHKSIKISPSQLAVLLPFHGAGVGSQRWVSVFRSN